MANPPQTFPQEAASALANPQYQSQFAGYLGGQAAPGIAAGQLSEAQALASAGVSPAAIQLGAQNLATNTGYGLAQDVGAIQNIGLQGQALGSQIGTAAQQQQIEKGQYGAQLQQLGLTQQATASERGYVGGEAQRTASEYGVTQAQLQNQQASIANQSAQIAYEYPLQVQQQQGQAAASGASNTVGNQNQLAQLAAVYGGQGFEQKGLGLQSQAAGLQGQAAGLQFQGQEAGLQQQQSQLGFTQQQNALNQRLAQLGQSSEVSGYKGQQQQYANAQQQLQLSAQQAGIPVQQAISQLGYGLQQLGIQNDPTQFIAQAATAQGTEAGDYAAALSAAAVSGGLGPQFAVGG